MADDYTPTVEEACADYARGFYENGGASLLDGEAAFDRLIARIRAEARRSILDDPNHAYVLGFRAGQESIRSGSEEDHA